MPPFGYHTVQHTPGLLVHDNRYTIFSLVVDDFLFNIPQQRMPAIFKFPQSQISYHSRYGSDSLHWNQVIVGLCAQNRHIVNAKLCVQGFAKISTHSEGWQEVIPPYLCPNPIRTENPICRPFGCSIVPLRKRNQPRSTSLWHFLILCHIYQQQYYP